MVAPWASGPLVDGRRRLERVGVDEPPDRQGDERGHHPERDPPPALVGRDVRRIGLRRGRGRRRRDRRRCAGRGRPGARRGCLLDLGPGTRRAARAGIARFRQTCGLAPSPGPSQQMFRNLSHVFGPLRASLRSCLALVGAGVDRGALVQRRAAATACVAGERRHHRSRTLDGRRHGEPRRCKGRSGARGPVRVTEKSPC